MYIIEINGTDYKLIQHWFEMTLKQGIELQILIKTHCPEKLISLYEAYNLKEEEQKKAVKKVIETFDNKDRIKTFPAFFGKVIKQLSNIPQKVIDKVHSEDRTIFYDKYCLPFVMGVYSMFPSDFKAKEIKHFDFENERYLLPVSETKLDVEIPMVNLTTLEFTESADLSIFAKDLEGGKLERAGNIISILCRPAGEKYNEKICLERAKRFDKLTMDVVWEVFFCIMQCSATSGQNMLIYLLQERLKEQRQEQKVA